MDDSIDCVGALSETVTELTRNGDTQAIIRILPYLESGRRLRLLHEWELAAIVEVSNMQFNDQKQLLVNMKKPVTVCKMISIEKRVNDDMVTEITFATPQNAAMALFKWAQSNNYVADCHEKCNNYDLQWHLKHEDDAINRQHACCFDKHGFHPLTLEECQTIVDSGKDFWCKGNRNYFECQPFATELELL